MKITMRDKIVLLIIATMICGWGEYKLICNPMQERINELNEEKEIAKGLLTDITPLLKESEKLKVKENQLISRIDAIKSSGMGKTVTNEDFLMFLGNSTAKNNVKVTGFNNLGVTSENDVYKMLIDMELRGNGADINNVLSDFDNMGVKYSVGSVSYRQNQKFDYLKRFYDDDTELPWYEEPDEEEIAKFNMENTPPTSDDFFGEHLTDEENYPEFDYSQDLSPDITVPEQTEPTPEPKPAPEEPKSIDDRIEQLLELTDFSKNCTNYGVKFLTNNSSVYKEGQDMRLAITVCLIMFDEPVLNSTTL